MNTLRTFALFGLLAAVSASPVMHQLIFEPTPMPNMMPNTGLLAPAPGAPTAPGGATGATVMNSPEPEPFMQMAPVNSPIPAIPGTMPPPPMMATPGPPVTAPTGLGTLPMEPTPLPPVVITMPTAVPPVAPMFEVTPAPFAPVASPVAVASMVTFPEPVVTPGVVTEVVPTPAAFVPSASAAPSVSPVSVEVTPAAVLPRAIPVANNVTAVVPVEGSPGPEVSPGALNDAGNLLPFSTFEPSDPVNETVAAVCFPASASVSLRDGSVKMMSDVQIGDQVHVGNGQFSDVFMFTHKLADAVHRFVQIDTSAGNKVTLTAGHYLYLNGKLSAADTARVGQSVVVDDKIASIVSVKSVSDVGLFNPQTVHGDIVVDGVLASTYTTAVHPGLGHALLSPFRALYERLGFSMNALERGADALARCMPNGQSVF